MPERMLGCAVVGCLLVLAVTGLGQAADGSAAGSGSEVTITGSLLCNRACIAEVWDHSPTSGDHTLVLFALEGTPELESELDCIMEECWRGRYEHLT